MTKVLKIIIVLVFAFGIGMIIYAFVPWKQSGTVHNFRSLPYWQEANIEFLLEGLDYDGEIKYISTKLLAGGPIYDYRLAVNLSKECFLSFSSKLEDKGEIFLYNINSMPVNRVENYKKRFRENFSGFDAGSEFDRAGRMHLDAGKKGIVVDTFYDSKNCMMYLHLGVRYR